MNVMRTAMKRSSLPYHIEVVRDEFGDFVAYVPTLDPMFFREIGESQQEAIDLLEDAMDALVHEWAFVMCKPMPPPSSIDLQIARDSSKPEDTPRAFEYYLASC